MSTNILINETTLKDNDYTSVDLVKDIIIKNKNEISIAWNNLRFEVSAFSGWTFQRKPILHRLNGFFSCNTLNGLMGPSGSGKSTLLNCLTGNQRKGFGAETEIYLNVKHKTTQLYFIEQQAHQSIVAHMKVGDIFRYAFKFKNGLNINQHLMEKHIAKIMAELMLPYDLLERSFEQCSGGEQKRIAIGQELMSLRAASFLFIDEPTTGLDSAAALSVIQCLKELVRLHRITVVASIHAPNNETLNLFDKLYVLAKGGVCIYSGPPNYIQSHLEQHLRLGMPEEQPPVEALLKIACNGKCGSMRLKTKFIF